eukprot:m.59724 g.59724  ORF g.59724 m.59724 type:complete len:641 (+) comp9476_c0_seq1:16-1938(+)
MVKVVITGGLGFLGQELAKLILREWAEVTSLVLVDATKGRVAAELEADARVTMVVEDITVPGIWSRLIDTPGMSVFHLAAIMSGHGEQDFELCMAVNLQSFMALLEQCRAVGGGDPSKRVRVTFASTGAVFGPLPLVTDTTKENPQTTYGTTKAISELLINDYSRKGFIDGRGARLPTVIVRPGNPNGASTSCYSGVIREPLDGVDVESPVSGDLKHAVCHYRTIVGGILQLHRADAATVAAELGQDRVLNLPSFSVTLKELYDTLVKVVTEDSGPIGVNDLGKVDFTKPDPRLDAIVSSMMNAINSERAVKLGLPTSPPLETCIREYIADFWSPPPPKVVGFVGCGFMGAGMIQNLAAKGGFTEVVICNRTKSKAEAVAASAASSGATTPVRVVDTPAEVARAASVICTCLASEAQGDAVYFGEDGVLSGVGKGSTVLDHATVSPAFTQKVRDAVIAAGGRFLDAPISGGPEGAAAGTLAIMCGGEPETFQSVLPVLNAMGTTIKLMGGPGAGTATKLVNQLLVGAHAAASAEAFRLAKGLGVTDFDLLMSVLENAWGQSRVLSRCGKFITQVEKEQNPELLNTGGAPMRNLLKDLHFVQAAATGAGLRAPIADAATVEYEAAAAAGLTEADISVLYNR